MSSTIVVDDSGTQLAYIDSGPPSGTVYATIFAVHGIVFTSPVFQKVSALARAKNLRFVAINRRGYSGSTPFSDADATLFTNGSDSDKADWLKRRGCEIFNFVDAFIRREKLSPVSADGKNGGIVLLGWSFGTLFTAAAIAHVAELPPPVQARLASYLRVHIMQEPPSIAFGLPIPPQTYSPELDTCLPSKARLPAFTIWLTSYFQHGDISTRDTNMLEYVVPATFRAPSIWNMSQDEISNIIETSPYQTFDTPFALNSLPQLHAVYETATFDETIKARLPHMQIWQVTGEATVSFCLAAFWSIEDDDKAHGGNNVNYKMLPGMSHFIHWDEPEKIVEVYLETLS